MNRGSGYWHSLSETFSYQLAVVKGIAPTACVVVDGDYAAAADEEDAKATIKVKLFDCGAVDKPVYASAKFFPDTVSSDELPPTADSERWIAVTAVILTRAPKRSSSDNDANTHHYHNHRCSGGRLSETRTRLGARQHAARKTAERWDEVADALARTKPMAFGNRFLTFEIDGERAPWVDGIGLLMLGVVPFAELGPIAAAVRAYNSSLLFSSATRKLNDCCGSAAAWRGRKRATKKKQKNRCSEYEEDVDEEEEDDAEDEEDEDETDDEYEDAEAEDEEDNTPLILGRAQVRHGLRVTMQHSSSSQQTRQPQLVFALKEKASFAPPFCSGLVESNLLPPTVVSPQKAGARIVNMCSVSRHVTCVFFPLENLDPASDIAYLALDTWAAKASTWLIERDGRAYMNKILEGVPVCGKFISAAIKNEKNEQNGRTAATLGVLVHVHWNPENIRSFYSAVDSAVREAWSALRVNTIEDLV